MWHSSQEINKAQSQIISDIKYLGKCLTAKKIYLRIKLLL